MGKNNFFIFVIPRPRPHQLKGRPDPLRIDTCQITTYVSAMETQNFWNFGEKSRLARVAGIDPSNLSRVLVGERIISLRMARKLEAASISVLGLRRAIPAACWLGLEAHPALGAERKEEACAE